MKTFTLLAPDGEPMDACFVVTEGASFDPQVAIITKEHGDPVLVWEHYTDLSADLGPARKPLFFLQRDEFIFKNYGERVGILEQLESLGLAARTGQTLPVGHAGDMPVCKLTKLGIEHVHPEQSGYEFADEEDTTA